MDITEELNCPICFERFTAPRSLNNCLHTFCEECLYQTFASFEKNERRPKELPCPVCRKTVPAPRAGVTKEWIQSFPTNHVVNSLMLSCMKAPDSAAELMSDSEGPKCEPCSDRNQNSSVRAVTVCVECQEFMCQPCSRQHKYYKFTKAHGVISVNDLKSEKKGPVNESKVLECEAHRDKCVELFCVDHNVLVCAICVATDHCNCKGIVQLKVHAESSDVVETTKQKKKKLKAMQKLLMGNIKQMMQNRSDLKDQESEIIKSIEDKRSQVLSLLNSYESELLEEFKNLRDKKVLELDYSIEKSKHLLTSMKSANMAYSSVLNHKSKAVTFATMVGMESQFSHFESIMAKDHSEVHTAKVALVDQYPLTCFLGSKSLGYADMRKYSPTISIEVSSVVKALQDLPIDAPVLHFKPDREPDAILSDGISTQNASKLPTERPKSDDTATRECPSPVEFTFLRIHHELQTSARGPLTDSVDAVQDEIHMFRFAGNAGLSYGGTAAQNYTRTPQQHASAASGNIGTGSASQPRGELRRPVSLADLYKSVASHSGEEIPRSRHSSWPDPPPVPDDYPSELTRFYRHPDNHQLYVANIPFSICEEELGDFFEQYGIVEAVTIKEYEGDTTRNYGFVTFNCREAVLDVLEDQPIYINGHRLHIAKKRKRRDTSLGRGGRGRGRGGF